MFTFAIDPITNDLAFDGQNNILLVSDNDEQTQAVRMLLSTSTNEWFLNLLFGLAYPYLQVKNPNENRIRAEIYKALKQETRIQSVDSVNVEFNSSARNLTITISLTMNDGNTVSEVLTF